MKDLSVNAVVLDLRKLSQETLDAYEKCSMNAAVALTTPRVQRLLAEKGIRLNVASCINEEDLSVKVNTLNGKVTLDDTGVPEGKVVLVLVVNGILTLKPETAAALEHYEKIIVNGKLYCPASLASAALSKCSVNGEVSIYPDEAVVLNGVVKLDRSFLFRAQPKLYWTDWMFVAMDPKLDAPALAASGATFAGRKAVLTESNAKVLAPLFADDTELMILPDGTAVLEDDLELSAGTLRRYGTRLYVAGDVTVPEGVEELLGRMEYLHVAGDVLLPAALEEAFYGIPDLEYGSLRVLLGHAIVGSPRLKLGKAMLDLYPQGVTCVDCAMVGLEETLEPDVIAKKLRFDGCAMVRCTEAQENAVLAVSKDVAKVQARDPRPEDEQETVRMNGVCLCL